MSSSTKPPPGGKGKPFLQDDDLLNELDAWDATFDALHAPSEPADPAMTLGPAPAAAEQDQPAAEAWRAPDLEPSLVGDATSLTASPPARSESVIELDDQMTLDAAIVDLDPGNAAVADADADADAELAIESETVDAAYALRPSSAKTLDVAAETDFSDLGAEAAPQPASLAGDDDDEDLAIQSAPRARRASKTLPPPMDDDDDVYTSASRPMPAAPGGDYEDDPVAPPPKPVSRSVPPTDVRRTPAIIRRASGGVEIPRAPLDESAFDGLSEQTRVASPNYDILEEVAAAQNRNRTTSPPPMEEEDFPDIEIGTDDSDGAPELAPSLASEPVRRTTTAHVVRRGDAPTRPPPAAVEGPVVEMDIDEALSAPVHQPSARPATEDFSDLAIEPARPATGAEEDFSDVGVDEDLEAPIDPPTSARVSLSGRTTPPPPPGRRAGTFDFVDDEAPPPTAARGLEEALVDLDDPENRAFEEDARTVGAPAYREPEPRGFDDEARTVGAPAYRDPEPARAPLPETAREMPALLDPERAAPSRPPGLMDLYRVKTPTSVPPLAPLPDDGDDNGPLTLMTRSAPDEARGDDAAPARASAARVSTVALEVEEPALPEPELDVENLGKSWPEQVEPLRTIDLDEAAAASLLVYEREVATLDDSETSAALRIEAGRLCERLSDLERARSHYDAALLADPRATAALRGLRRIARASGDLAEATRHLDTEIAVAGALERRPLGHYRVDMLMASGEQDLARVAVGEILDSAPSDTRALLAHLELAFLDGRAEEFGLALEQLAHAVGDNELRAAVQSARGVIAAHHNDTAGATSWFAAANESDPAALASRLGAIRYAAAQADGEGASRALVDLARQVEAADPIASAAAAIRAQAWSTNAELRAAAAIMATSAASSDPLVARLSAESVADSAAEAPGAFAHWASVATSPVERAYASARAAELDPSRAAELWATVLSLDPGDDYAAAQLRTAHVAAEATQDSIDVDLSVATDVERDRARLRAAYGMIAEGQLDAAIDVLAQGRAARPTSLAIAEALGEALAAAGKWTERAKLFAELAQNPGDQLDAEVAQLRSALAWEEAVGAATATPETDPEELARSTRSSLDAWGAVLERDPQSPTAHAASIVLASRMGDLEIYGEVLARAQAAERSQWGAASLAMRRARLVAATDPDKAEAMARDIQPADDPRRSLALVLAAARKRDYGDAALALEDRANQLDQRGAATEVAALRLRAAQLALDDNDAPRATRLLQQVETALPHLGVVPDLLAAARRRAGDRPSPAVRRTQPAGATVTSSLDAFARVLHDADLASQHGDNPTALALYQQALEMRPHDPLATLPMIRTATELRETAPITSLAFGQLRAAEEAGDNAAKGAAYELLAMVDAELRGDPASAQEALESASQADPSRVDLLHRLERHYASGGAIADLLRVRKAALDAIPDAYVKDRAALQLDVAGLATRDNRPELEIADIYRKVLVLDPATRLALLHLESIVRRSGSTEELAELEQQIAAYFEGDARTQAAFWTRAGETLAELGKIDEAVQRFGKAEAAAPGHAPALEGWRQAALKGQLWIDVADAASRQAAATEDAAHKAKLYHFAGVTLMDKALNGEQAMVAFKRALDADASHKDSFLRMRILLEEDANHDDLATLLAQRLDVETDPRARIEMHRALAELHRNFLSDRDTAKQHYRMILESDANDLRAHAAVADISWEQGNWQDAADALMSRARLEREPEILKTLCFRLGLIYADRLVDVPMALKAFQRALTYQPDDEQTLVRLADLATQSGEWKLALGACERLVKNETDSDIRAQHLHRVARIFRDGFGDLKRAERALNLALDGAPTNDEALQAVVAFYREQRDITSVRVHLNRVAGAMRARVQKEPSDGVAYRVISRAMLARATTNAPGSRAIARSAAELAELLGAAGEPEQRLVQEPNTPDLSMLVRPESDEIVFPRGVQLELRQVFQLLGDRIAKHVGVDLRPYGVARGDRLKPRENAVASVAQSVAHALGFTTDIDVYVSNRQPWAMVAEPTSPVSLILGSAIANAGGDAIRFAAGAALKLAQASLAIPARLPLDDLGVLTVALLRLFQPEFPGGAVDADAVAAQMQKLKRLIPSSLLNELKPYALAVDAQRFGHRELARDLRDAGLRAGLVASGSLTAGLRILSGANGAELSSFLADPVALRLVSFAVGEEHAALAR